MHTFADKVIEFNRSLEFKGTLPERIRAMNPFKENADVLKLSSDFYKKYYNDHNTRFLILGINPGRFGAGVTGIPFTDTKRLKSECHMPYSGKETHEPSSVFIYEMIAAYGGPEKFYRDFYINSVSPLGFTIADDKGKEKNYNYYDSKALTAAVVDFSVQSIRTQLEFGIDRSLGFCFGTGKNEKFLRSLNEQHHFFDELIALEHPRYIMQYKSKSKQFYIDKYLRAFHRIKERDY